MFGFLELVEAMERGAGEGGHGPTLEKRQLCKTKIENAACVTEQDLNMNPDSENHPSIPTTQGLKCKAEEFTLPNGTADEPNSEIRTRERRDTSTRNQRRPCGTLLHDDGHMVGQNSAVGGDKVEAKLEKATVGETILGKTIAEKVKRRRYVIYRTANHGHRQTLPAYQFLGNNQSFHDAKESEYSKLGGWRGVSGENYLQCQKQFLPELRKFQNTGQIFAFHCQNQQLPHNEHNFQNKCQQLISDEREFQYDNTDHVLYDHHGLYKHQHYSGRHQECIVGTGQCSPVKKDKIMDDLDESCTSESKNTNKRKFPHVNLEVPKVAVSGDPCYSYSKNFPLETAFHQSTRHCAPQDTQSDAASHSGRSSKHLRLGHNEIHQRIKPFMNNHFFNTATLIKSGSSKNDSLRHTTDGWIRGYNGESELGWDFEDDPWKGGRNSSVFRDWSCDMTVGAEANTDFHDDTQEIQRTNGRHTNNLASSQYNVQQQHTGCNILPTLHQYHVKQEHTGYKTSQKMSHKNRCCSSHTIDEARNSLGETAEESEKFNRGRQYKVVVVGIDAEMKRVRQEVNSTQHKSRNTSQGLPTFTCELRKVRSQGVASQTRYHRLHAPTRPYPCCHCPSRFNQLVHLQIHQRTHTGEKPFCCHTCGSRFNRKDRLKCHERIHTGEKPYPCPQCESSFQTVTSLRVHLHTHNPQTHYTCRICHAIFTHLSTFTAHWRMHDCGSDLSANDCTDKAKEGPISK
ncbi:uncharacterized protein [Cherax quadricarinatus]